MAPGVDHVTSFDFGGADPGGNKAGKRPATAGPRRQRVGLLQRQRSVRRAELCVKKRVVAMKHEPAAKDKATEWCWPLTLQPHKQVSPEHAAPPAPPADPAPYTAALTYMCDHCGQLFQHKHRLIQHIKAYLRGKNTNVLKEIKPYSCEICNKAFKRSEQLKMHQRVHTDAAAAAERLEAMDGRRGAHGCGACVKIKHARNHSTERYTTTSNLKRHADVKPYACELCNKTFSDPKALKVHERRHAKEKPYSCDVCGKGFADPSNLRKHQRTHTADKYSCETCKKEFANPRSLKDHRRIHTGEKPYVCEVCKKEFTVSSNFKRHANTHTGERPYPCDVCGKTFTQYSTMKEHARIHTGEKPYSCKMCEKKFSALRCLRRHERIHARVEL